MLCLYRGILLGRLEQQVFVEHLKYKFLSLHLGGKITNRFVLDSYTEVRFKNNLVKDLLGVPTQYPNSTLQNGKQHK